MPKGQGPTNCGVAAGNDTGAHRRNLNIPLICNCTLPLLISESPDLSLARRFHLFAVTLVAQKHIPRPVTDGLSTRTNMATYTCGFMIDNGVLDHRSVPAEYDKARRRHARPETRRNLFLAVS